jgi:Glycosyltransferase 61
VSLYVTRLKHHTKVFVGNQLGRFLNNQYSSGRGPASRVISVFSDKAKKIGVESNILVGPVPVKKLAPDFFLDGHIETEYRNLLLSGEDSTGSAGIFSVRNVDVSFPTSMHQIGDHILKEVMLTPSKLTNPKYYYGLESMRFMRKQPMSDGVLLSMQSHHNFYHWMIEMLPRLISYDRCPSLQHVPLMVPKSCPRYIAESLRLAGYLPKTIFLKDGVYRFENLRMLSMLAPVNEVSSDAVDWLNKKFISVSSTLNPPKRIYVSRRDAKIRYVANEAELLDVLTQFGFETLTMSDLSLADQINVFRNAECIVGPHGAAFASLAFSKPRSIFIEFFCRGHWNPAYNRISGIRGLKYGFLVGEPNGLGGFSINPNHLRAILSQAM